MTTTEALPRRIDEVSDASEPVRWARRSFRSMGTLVTLIGPADAAAAAAVDEAFGVIRATFSREDDRFSRFREATELSRVNATAGRWTRVSKPFHAVLRAALDAARRTGGLFDPTVLPALLAIGYDRDFDDVIAGGRLALHPPEPCGRWREIRLRDDRVLVPGGVALDFGGIAKGWTVDRAARRVRGLLPWAMVDAGGDLRVVGRPPGGAVDIGVEDPHDPGTEILRLRVGRGAIATSAVTARAWGPDRHHLIDPRTGLPARTGVVQATVWGPTCAKAEVGSKWALLAPDRALERLPVVLVRDDGAVVTNLDGDERAEHGRTDP